MTENGNPYENTIAERVNGILKTEFNLAFSGLNYQQTKEKIAQRIYTYNHQRPHASCNYLTPVQAHKVSGVLKKKWVKKTIAIKMYS